MYNLETFETKNEDHAIEKYIFSVFGGLLLTLSILSCLFILYRNMSSKLLYVSLLLCCMGMVLFILKYYYKAYIWKTDVDDDSDETTYLLGIFIGLSATVFVLSIAYNFYKNNNYSKILATISLFLLIAFSIGLHLTKMEKQP